MPLLAVLALAGCGDPSISAIDPQGPVASEQFFLMKLSLAVMIFVFAVVMIIYIYVLVRYRKKKGQDQIPKQVEGNHVLEIIWTVIPILLLIVIAVPTIKYTFEHSKDLREEEGVVHIKVTAHQFWWQFEYPDNNINTAQDMYIPVGKRVALELTSSDVKHSFWVPALAGKIDTNPGMSNIMHLQADKPGIYRGKCAELCGASHSLMDFKVVAVSEAEYNQWVEGKKTPAKVTADTAKGEQVFKDNCLSCHAVGGEGAGLGPNLNGFANRTEVAGVLPHDAASVKKWIQDPQAQKPGTKMPKVNLNEDQVDQLVKYLETLK